jgi:transposase-like protein
MSARRRYSDTERADALKLLATEGGNVQSTARRLGIPRRTLGYWAAQALAEGRPKSGESAPLKKKGAGLSLKGLAWRLLGLDPATVHKANGLRLVIAVASAIDMARRLRGLPTSI